MKPKSYRIDIHLKSRPSITLYTDEDVTIRLQKDYRSQKNQNLCRYIDIVNGYDKYQIDINEIVYISYKKSFLE